MCKMSLHVKSVSLFFLQVLLPPPPSLLLDVREWERLPGKELYPRACVLVVCDRIGDAAR